MNLLSPYGVQVSVSDEYGEELLQGQLGFKRVGAANAAPSSPAPEKKTPSRKSNKTEE